MHPELFELKALVAGRLDAHRRREIDDHLGSCADCSRHYVALMLGSSSPKTAEAEARQGFAAAGTVLTLMGGTGSSTVEVFGIDAPLSPSVPRPPAKPAQSNGSALETEFPSVSRTQVPVSASLTDVIARLRAESDAQKSADAGVATSAAAAAEVVAVPAHEAPLIEPSIFAPTPADGVSIIRPRSTPSAGSAAPERPAFMTRPASASPTKSVETQPELVVTFSSTPSRISSYRSPGSVAVVTPSADQAYVSQAVPNMAHDPTSDFAVSDMSMSRAPKSATMRNAAIAAIALVVAISGYRYFQSSVAQAAAAAAKQVQADAAAAPKPSAPAPTTAAPPPSPAPVQTRIVYVDRPAKSSPESKPRESSGSSISTPAIVTIPDVNVSTGSADAAIQGNSQRSATSELTRSARPTSTRTAVPRP